MVIATRDAVIGTLLAFRRRPSLRPRRGEDDDDPPRPDSPTTRQSLDILMRHLSEANAPIQWNEVERIAVLRALYLGDMLCSVPALRALRHAAPHAQITLFGLPWAAEFCARLRHFVDEFAVFPGYPGLPEQPVEPDRILSSLASAQRKRFDLAIQLHGSGQHVNDAIQLFGARRTAGFYATADDCLDGATFIRYPEDESEVWRNLRLMHHLGAPLVGDHLELEVSAEDCKRLKALLAQQRRPTSGYVCIHAGSKWQSRRWPVERFAEVANALAAEGYPIVLTGGAGEQGLVEELSSQLQRPHGNLCGKTDLGTLAAAVQGAQLVITNDTGISHVAAATRTPSVVVVLGSDPARWAPLNSHLHEVVVAPLDCRPCPRYECPADRRCGETVAVHTVLAAAHDVLERTRSKAVPIRPADVEVEPLLMGQPWKGSACVA